MVIGRGFSEGFFPTRPTLQPSWIFNKFEGEEIWGLDSHRDDPSGEKGTALNWWVENGGEIPQLQNDPLLSEPGSE